ncbi:MAG: AgmX/PglI C-terminal domain-containing protein [Myxococcales bacterium]|nr:MAG: AgmX/PglI C-terminal domain-containing protein [Myxococcales bacterium]
MQGWTWVSLAVFVGGLGCAAKQTPSARPAVASPRASRELQLARAHDLTVRAGTLVEQHRAAQARALLSEALPLLTPGSLEHDRQLCQLQRVLADSFLDEGARERAVPALQAEVEAATRHEPELAETLVEAQLRLAATYQALAQHAPAALVLEQALAVTTRQRPVAERAPAVLAHLAISYAVLGRTEEADRLMATYGEERSLSTAAIEPEPAPIAIVDHGSFRPPAHVPPAPAPALAPSPSAPPAPAPSPPPTSGQLSDVASKVGAMRADFRACYQAALNDDWYLQGRLRLTIQVGPNGHVTSARIKSLGLPAGVVDCVLKRASSTVFVPPEGGKAVIAVPVTFVKQ